MRLFPPGVHRITKRQWLKQIIYVYKAACVKIWLSIVQQGQERRGDLSAWVDQEGSTKRHSCWGMRKCAPGRWWRSVPGMWLAGCQTNTQVEFNPCGRQSRKGIFFAGWLCWEIGSETFSKTELALSSCTCTHVCMHTHTHTDYHHHLYHYYHSSSGQRRKAVQWQE